VGGRRHYADGVATTPYRDPSQPWVRRKRDAFRRRLQLVRTLRYAPAGLVATVAAITTVSGLLPVAFILAGGLLTREIEGALARSDGRDLQGVIVAFLLLMGLFLLSEMFLPLQGRLRWLLSKRIDGVARHRAIEAALAGNDMAHLHDEEMLRGLRRVRGIVEHAVTPGTGATGTLGVAREYLTGLACAAILIRFDPLLGVVVLAVALALRLRWRAEVIAIIDAWIDGLDAMSEARYFVELGLGRQAALEARLFGLRDWIRQRITVAGIRGWTPTWRNRTLRLGRQSTIQVALSGGIAVIALRWGADQANRGSLTVADLAVFVPALFSVLGLGRVFNDDTAVEYGAHTLPGLEHVEAGAALAVSREAVGRRVTPTENAPAIDLRGVSFRYPGTDADVLRSVDLAIPSGSSAAIVGLNGAGKSTLVRLMCGLYAPDRGTVSVDGVDLRQIDLDAWHRRIAPMFQEFVRLQVSVRQNVTAGAPERSADEAELREVLDDAGVTAFADRLPDGLETPLATWYADGTDLSGGQWQRVGVARAIYALDAGARFLILDEPTSNLDTSSEERLVERLLVGTAGEVTKLLITHRLSLARRTDRIFVLEQGEVVEQGSHDDLIAMGGRYASAFAMQAAMYPLEEPDE
jgi:ATP-binding cassette, subfamily B, bacterial